MKKQLIPYFSIKGPVDSKNLLFLSRFYILLSYKLTNSE